ncbi:MAG TPA: tRNA pseudouridine(55) synthase TruB [Gammaproteobacteria bacterium]|nr:tRNA pseudouridine(55) synthase TruB [Gammaproteobacteria bacterium]
MTRKRPGRDVRGVLLLDKPRGLTSNRALQRVKRLFGAAKAGHTGSLDPLATGMLPICFGPATKLSGYLLEGRKTYAVTAALGVATDTGDADGTVTERSDAPPPDLGRVRAVLESFVGESDQVPPMYSALKQEGRRLYELARQGIVVERKARTVRIFELGLDRYAWPELAFTVSCSKGTYVRTLVVDVAARLGTLAHVTALRRLGVGPFGPEAMVELERVEAAAEIGFEALDRLLLPMDGVLADRPSLTLSERDERAIREGRPVQDRSWPAGVTRLYAADGRFLGVAEISAEGALAKRRLFGA